MFHMMDWIKEDNDITCDNCGDEQVVRGIGGDGLKLTCDNARCSCEPTCQHLTRQYDSENVSFTDFDNTFTYQCPECGSQSIERKPYDDGLGYYDVRVTCEVCGEETWE